MNRGNGPHQGVPGDSDPLHDMDDADVADMWVMNPDSGSFELRAPGAAGDGGAEVPAPRRESSDGEATRAPASAAASTQRAEGGSRRRGDAPAPTGRAAARNAPPKNRTRRRLKWIALSVVGLMVVLAGSAYGYMKYLDSKITTTQKNGGSDGIPEAEEDAFGRKALNIVLIGNDSRKGLGKKYGAAEHVEGLADVTILMHVSADRTNATLVSIPRDTMVEIPTCVIDGETFAGSVGKAAFNSSLAHGGPPCTVSTVDKMLGVQVDHYIMIDFTGVKKITDAVDGVDMCLSAPINDPVLPNKQGGTGLNLPAGDVNLKGETALQFLRARHAFGDGSDLARIKAQKAFLMALTRKLKGSASLSNVDGMLGIAKIAVESLTVDKGLGGVQKLVSLGNQLKKVPEKRMAFLTLPVEDYPPDKNRVQPRQPDAENLMAMLREDISTTEEDKPATPTAPASTAAPKIDPATMTVDVRNGGGVQGKATEVATALVKRKFVAAAAGNAKDGKSHPTSSITYPKGKLEEAKLLASATGLPAGALVEATGTTTRFEVLIGKDYPTKVPAKPAPTKAPKNLEMDTADNNKCAPTKN